MTGCQAVPKMDQTNDQFCWRLSFSRGERILSENVPSTTRLAFLAVKLAWKHGLKSLCSSLKSYHLKTAFYHFLENVNPEDLKKAELEQIFISLICFLIMNLERGHICHFFIREVNLISHMTESDRFTCVTFFKQLGKRDMEKVFSESSRVEIMIQQFKEDKSKYHFIIGTIILIAANIVGICGGVAAYLIIFIITITLFICFLYSLIITLPMIGVSCILFKIVLCLRR